MTAPPQTGERSPAEERAFAAKLEVCRRFLLPFIKYTRAWYEIYPWARLVAAELEAFDAAVERGESPRLIIEIGPRIGKSEIVTRTYLPWTLGRHPDEYAGIVSYGDELAWELSGDGRKLVTDEPFAEIFGSEHLTESVEIDPKTQSVTHWKLKDHRGGMRAAGIGGALVGRGFKRVIFDDPVKGRKEADSKRYREDQWNDYWGTFYNRVEPGGGIVIVMQRWHKDDIVGRLLQAAEDDPEADQWRVVCIPAQWEDGRGLDPTLYRESGWLEGRFSDEQWERLKRNTPPREWASKYQQRPIPEEGQIFHPYEEFIFADPPRPDDEEYKGPRYGFSDTSHAKNRASDFSAIGIFQVEPPRIINGTHYRVVGILDFFHGRVQYPDLKKIARDLYHQWGLWTFVIEDYSSGVALKQEFARESGMRVMPYRPDRDKEARAHAANSAIDDWKIRVPAGERFPSGCLVKTFLDELNDFAPGGDIHDDMVDCFTMAIINMCVRNPLKKNRIVSTNFSVEM